MASSSGISLDDLIALNDEIVALSRAGIPLHRGLISLGDELPGRSGCVATALGQRLEAGESLEAALEAVGRGRMPEAYLAVVRAGLRAGRLPAALEGIATASRRAAQLRRTVGLALFYPTVVCLLAYLLLLLALVYWVPTMVEFYRELQVPLPAVVEMLAWLGGTASYWAWLPPLLAVVGLLVWWRSGRVFAVGGRGGGRRGTGFGRRGWGELLRAGRLAGFAEVLALLVEQQVPLPESLTLAGDASGDRGLAAGCRELAERLRRGHPAAGGAMLPRQLPALLGWMILNARDPGELAQSLRRSASSYRTRARELGDWLSVYLPMWLTAVVGGTAVAIYVLVIFLPWTRILIHLSGSA